jgi:two-component system, LytTR family, response regulator
MSRIRALIVDDEPFARDRVRRLLAGDADIEVVGECADGFEAVVAIQSTQPDLLFLDVKMPGKDGFEVLEEVATPAPVVIFLTAYDQFALRAFEACALDYLLKPFDEERFEKALSRAKAALAAESPGELGIDQDSPATIVPPASGPLRRLVVRVNGRLLFIKVDDVSRFEASGNYVALRVGTRTYSIRDTLANLEAQLDPSRFVRVHRSAIINFERIRELHPLFYGQYRIVFDDESELTMSRRYRANLERLLGRPLT